MTGVYNVKTKMAWSWTFSNEEAALAAIKKGHSHNTDHLITINCGGDIMGILTNELSTKISELFLNGTDALSILIGLKFYEKYIVTPLIVADTIYELNELGLIDITGSPKLTEMGNLIITRLLIKAGITREMIDDALKEDKS